MKPIITVLCPMPMEFAAVEKAFGKLGETLETVFEEKKFDFNGLDVILARSGIGKTFAAAKAQRVIQTYEPDHIFICGVAGAISEKLNVFDVVVPNRIVHGDVCFGDTYSPTEITESSAEFLESSRLCLFALYFSLFYISSHSAELFLKPATTLSPMPPTRQPSR